MNMRLKFKIILLFLLCFVIFTSTVQAVDQVYFSIVNWNNNEPYIVYRTVVKPDSGTAIDLHRIAGYNNWSYSQANKTGGGEPVFETYMSKYLIVTNDRLGNYTWNTSSPYGYLKYTPKASMDLMSSANADDFSLWKANMDFQHVLVDVVDNEANTIFKEKCKNGAATCADSQKVVEYVNDEEAQKPYLNNILNIGNVGDSILPTAWVNRTNENVWLSSIYDSPNLLNKLVTHTELRWMLYKENYDLYFVSDVMLDTQTTRKFLAEYKNDDDKVFFVSHISKTHDGRSHYYYLLTPWNFLHAKSSWSPGTNGKTLGGWQSGLNLWDNQLVLNSDPSIDIVINHVFVEEKSDGSKEYVNIKVPDNISSLMIDGEKTLKPNNYNAGATLAGGGLSYSLKEEYKLTNPSTTSKYNVESILNSTKESVITLTNNKEIPVDQVEMLGYSLYTGEDILAVEDFAATHTNAFTQQGEFEYNEDTSAYVVNVYYTVPKAEIQVRHYVIGEGYIKGNGYAEIATGNIYPNQAIYHENLIEVYEDVNLNNDIKFSRKTDIESRYTYIGYELNSKDITTSKITKEDESIVVNKDTETFNNQGNVITIVFKYKTNTPGGAEPDKTYKDAPSTKIDGILSVKSVLDIETMCEDSYSVPGDAIDGKKDLFVGIKQIPNYILAGMSVRNLEHTDSMVKINIEIKFGPQSKTWTVEVPYYFSYYIVENLLLYKYDYATIYNTKMGADTLGERVFSTRDNMRTIRPTKTSSLVLWSTVNEDITNSSKELSNWKNYLATSYKMNYSPTTDPNRSTSIIGIPQTLSSYQNEHKEYSALSQAGYRRQSLALIGFGSGNIVKKTVHSQEIEVQNGVSNKTEYYGSMENNNISEYITYYSEDTGIANEQRKAYTQIALDGEANITIDLLDGVKFIENNNEKSLFELISSGIEENGVGKDVEIGIEDIRAKIAATNEAVNKVVEERSKFETVYNNYKTACEDSSNGGMAFPTCYEEASVSQDYYSLRCEDRCKNPAEEGGCATYWSCTDNENAPSVCNSCEKYGDYVKNLQKSYNAYNSGIDRYESAIQEAIELYHQEIFALKHFDEAYYIQEELWNVYKEYDVEQIVKLLDLDIKFDYSSGGASLIENQGDNPSTTNLMAVNSHSVELNTDPSKNVVLNGYLNKLVSLTATRQQLADKTYYTDGIKTSSWIADDITENNYSNNTYDIPINTLNGKRILAGNAVYNIDTNNIVGTKSTKLLDNMYYNTGIQYGTSYTNVNGYTEGVIGAQKDITETLYNIKTNTLTKSYGANKKNSDEKINSQTFNIYTPLVVHSEVNQDVDIIDQTTTNEYSGVDVIQANSKFTVSLSSNYDDPISESVKKYKNNIPSDFTKRYLNKASYYIKFEFDVEDVSYKDSTDVTRKKGSFSAGTWIGPIYGNKIHATARMNTAGGGSITDLSAEYYVLAVAVNTSNSWTELVLDYMDTSLGDITDTALLNNLQNVCGVEGGKKISYYASTTGTLVIVNRIYDFRVTDVKDVNWEKVFRSTASQYVNNHSQIAYYSGISKWNTQDPIKYNEIVGRTEEEIGTTPARVLPVGPYKNTDKSYIAAPKMGYRFSFDLKVTGAKDEEKSVTIMPKFYYISKDGTKYYSEYSSGHEGIYLFYKNSKGQYVRIGATNDSYKIQFTPYDGYRLLVEGAGNTLSKNNIVLGNLRELTLKFGETTTYSSNDSSITYYGEYKLPNSTIAVLVDSSGKYNINKPLSNGYIGVIFEIQANEINNTQLSYGKNSYIPGGSGVAKVNTSQWDYEGYLGISNPGENYETTLRLEKGSWNIDNAMYNKIKGTVILYDLDNKASNDFN